VPSKHEALNSNPRTTKQQKRTGRGTQETEAKEARASKRQDWPTLLNTVRRPVKKNYKGNEYCWSWILGHFCSSVSEFSQHSLGKCGKWPPGWVKTNQETTGSSKCNTASPQGVPWLERILEFREWFTYCHSFWWRGREDERNLSIVNSWAILKTS
jgi:hypothetical protein